MYWDASAILSILFKDRYSSEARRWADSEGLHLICTLAYAQTSAVIARFEREGLLGQALVQEARENLEGGPWHRLNARPDWKTMRELSVKWPLRGADLWHLATAKGLQRELPELLLLTFDTRLRAAAKGEGLIEKPSGLPRD